MKASIYNIEGKEIDTVLLPKEIFQVSLNHDLVYQIVLAQTANRRKNIAHTKDRSEVRGGGKKPWRQKGTGRARHGSRRSPLWKGGGVTFGPTKEKNFKMKINKKAKRKALFMVLSEKLKANLLFFFDKIQLKENKTKKAAEMVKVWRDKIDNFKQGKILIILSKQDKEFVLAVRNLPNIKVTQAKDLNVLDLLESKYLIMVKESIELIKQAFLNEKKEKNKTFSPDQELEKKNSKSK